MAEVFKMKLIKFMTKKEFTGGRVKNFNEMSDVELIEELDKGIHSPAAINTIKAILDKRTKKSIQHLTEVIQKSGEITEKYNGIMINLAKKNSQQTKWLIILTIVIAILTLLMLVGLGIQIWLVLK